MNKVTGPCADAHCNRPAVSRVGFCLMHYKRWKRRGTTHDITPEVRFFSYIQPAPNWDDCWIWMKRLEDTGYARFRVGKKPYMAHRWSFEFLRVEIPYGLDLDHLCRNSACVNPWHLEPVNDYVNVVVRGTGLTARNARKTHCLRGHPFDEANTYITPKRGRRQCRACGRIREQQRN